MLMMAKRPARAARQQDAFFRHMVGNMRNGVLAIDREGGLVILNDEARRLFALEPGDDVDRHAVRRRAPSTSRHRPRPRRRVRVEVAPQPRGAAAEVHRHGDRLHAVAGTRRTGRAGGRGAVFQGPHPRRTDGRARAPARSARRRRRDGRGDGARNQEPAGRHRGARRPAAPQGARQPRRPVAGRRHHQRSEDGERDRAGSAGVRAAGAAAGGSHALVDAVSSAVSLADGKATRGNITVGVSLPGICRRSAPTSIS